MLRSSSALQAMARRASGRAAWRRNSLRTMSTVLPDHLMNLSATMPPGYTAQVGQLETFKLPERVTGTPGDRAMGRALVDAWRRLLRDLHRHQGPAP
ncbi:Clavaminate synthase-like protein [Apiospora arundinis]|uniref:Clavaminate synthase-like protein n=1 Tax=Apiospora arundinis TaxID=335852 RepID=A0ABR2IWT9_9PEZI